MDDWLYIHEQIQPHHQASMVTKALKYFLSHRAAANHHYGKGIMRVMRKAITTQESTSLRFVTYQSVGFVVIISRLYD